MKINVTHTDKLTAAISNAQGPRVTARIITADDVQNAVERIQDRLDTLMARKYQSGITATVDVNAQSFPGAYRGTPESTHFRVVRTASGWFVTGIYRANCLGPTSRVQINLSDHAEAMIRHAEQSFNR